MKAAGRRVTAGWVRIILNIIRFRGKNKMPPSQWDLARMEKKLQSTINHRLQRMKRNGLVTWDGRTVRTLQVTRQGWLLARDYLNGKPMPADSWEWSDPEPLPKRKAKARS